ncbi:hypothetical protein Fmac_003004 [Flemingia macrophylla]|uniref:Uncharacterized protein n=1 Tax=Flemingia macrophylla TaxID=520843 RepID=A0ABD1NLJ2_9FABA
MWGSMLKLAELLVLEGIHVTFLITESNHQRLLHFGDIEALSACYPTFHLKVISDGYNVGRRPPWIQTVMAYSEAFPLPLLLSYEYHSCFSQPSLISVFQTSFTTNNFPLEVRFLDWAMSWPRQSLEADVLMLNTMEDLKGPVLSQIHLRFPKVYAVGPLHHHLNLRKTSDHHIPNFDTSTIVKRQDLMEIWHGLVNSNKRFLWVIRPEIMPGKDNHDRIPAEWVELHPGQCCCWGCPWSAGVTLLINSRFVAEVWKLGLDMKDVCDRKVVENMVNDLMVHKKEDFLRSAQEMAMLAHKSVSPGGSLITVYKIIDSIHQM